MTDNARIFETEDQAHNAIERLVAGGFNKSDTLLLTPSTGNHEGAVMAAIADGFMPSAYRRSITQSLEQGRSVVAITPPFGSAQLAAEILEECNPVDTDSIPEISYSNPTPLSDFLGIPALSNVRSTTTVSNRTTFSSSSLLSKKTTIFGFKTLTDNKSKSSSFGLPLLSKKTTILGFKPLTSNKSKDRSFGIRLLSSNPTPISSMFGMRVLSRRD
ncbi:MAG: hypothetical protein AB8G17_06825 [Gammaproteobacteria bacterium]